MSQFFKSLLKATGNEYGASAFNGVEGFEVSSWLDTGSLAFNALVSSSLWKGIPGNKVLGLAGEEAVGKTWYAISLAKSFLDVNPEGVVFYFETEGAITKDMLVSRGIDLERFYILPVNTVEDFRTQALKLVTEYDKSKEKPGVMLCLDSLGNLSTNKEMTDMESGSEKKDMTRPGLIKAAFRAITLKSARNNIPIIVTNHTYTTVGSFIPLQEMSGGSGLRYCASTIVFLSKRKDRDTTDATSIIGNVITIKLVKSRFSKVDQKVETLLNFESGLDRYFGLLPIAEKAGIFKKLSKKYMLPDGTEISEGKIKKNPEKYYTKEVLQLIEEFCNKEYAYGANKFLPVEDEVEGIEYNDELSEEN